MYCNNTDSTIVTERFDGDALGQRRSVCGDRPSIHRQLKTTFKFIKLIPPIDKKKNQFFRLAPSTLAAREQEVHGVVRGRAGKY